jgi:hypothetical protein
MNTIRASSLVGLSDCSLRQAASNWPRLFEEKGHALRRLGRSIGSALGSGVHKAVLPVLFSDGLDAALKAGREYLEAQQDHELLYDSTTPHMMAAQEQAERIIRTIAASPVMDCEPVLIEQQLTARIDDDTQLDGHPDLYTKDETCRDLKTGKLARPYALQLGCYSLLLRSNGHGVKRLVVDYVGRRKHDEPEHESTEYPVRAAEKAAMAVITRTTRELKEFAASGEPTVWNANGMSLMCSEKWCSLWGTSTCTAWMK